MNKKEMQKREERREEQGIREEVKEGERMKSRYEREGMKIRIGEEK